MLTIEMGLNTEPNFNLPEGIDNLPEDLKGYWEKEVSRSLHLKGLIEKALAEYGECRLNWSCEGASRFDMHSSQWAYALQDYEFEISRYTCIVRLKTSESI